MIYNIAVDSGGTKVLALLYDENFNLLKTVRVGSMRTNTTSNELIEKNLDELEQGLFGDSSPEIGCLSGALTKVLVDRLSKKYRINKILNLNELILGMNAAFIFGDGLMSLSGTGATTFARIGGKPYYLGGYGAAVSDEGSGYWKGRIAFDAAIKSFEGRGRKTLLEKLLCNKLGNNNLRDAVMSIYSQPGISPVAFVASCSPLVDEAAYMGDEAAIDIIGAVGESLGDQLNAIVRMNGISSNVPVTVSGSVWKGHPLMFTRFCEKIREVSENRPIVIPEFEPIIGAIIEHYKSENKEFDDQIKQRFRNVYSEYFFKTNNKNN